MASDDPAMALALARTGTLTKLTFFGEANCGQLGNEQVRPLLSKWQEMPLVIVMMP